MVSNTLQSLSTVEPKDSPAAKKLPTPEEFGLQADDQGIHFLKRVSREEANSVRLNDCTEVRTYLTLNVVHSASF